MKQLVITGAGSGIGAEIAKQASAQGYRVGVMDVDADAVAQVVEELINGYAMVCDVTNAENVAQCFTEFGQIDGLVNNAGILRTGALLDQSVEDFKAVIEVNLTSVFVVAQAAARMMQDTGGAIVNMSSINAIHPSPNCGAYVPAKAGVQAMTQQMALEWGELGIRVNAVAPGFVDAGMSTPFYQDKAVRNRRAAAVPLKRLGTAQDIVNAVMFLLSDQAAYISGETLTVDGGVINSVLKQLPRE